MEKAYKYRIYPNKKQKEIIAKTFGCCRFVYNTYLAKRIEMILSILVYTFFSRMFDLMLHPAMNHSTAVA